MVFKTPENIALCPFRPAVAGNDSVADGAPKAIGNLSHNPCFDIKACVLNQVAAGTNHKAERLSLSKDELHTRAVAQGAQSPGLEAPAILGLLIWINRTRMPAVILDEVPCKAGAASDEAVAGARHNGLNMPDIAEITIFAGIAVALVSVVVALIELSRKRGGPL